ARPMPLAAPVTTATRPLSSTSRCCTSRVRFSEHERPRRVQAFGAAFLVEPRRERERREPLAVAGGVTEHDLAAALADADVDVVELAVGVALCEVAVEVVQPAGELVRAR